MENENNFMTNKDLSFNEAMDFVKKGFLIRRKAWERGIFCYEAGGYTFAKENLADRQARGYVAKFPEVSDTFTISKHIDCVYIRKENSYVQVAITFPQEDKEAHDWEFILTDEVINDLENVTSKLEELKNEGLPAN